MTSQEDVRTSVDAGEVTEATTLLDAGRSSATRFADRHRRRVIFVTFIVLFCLELGAGLVMPGITVALEQKICDHINAGLEAVDKDCKAPAVQGQLAVLRGWQTTVDCIPGLVATVPYGILADKWGRHRAIILACTGTTMSLAFQLFVAYSQSIPVQVILFSPVFYFLGGGPAVISAMAFTSVADVTPVSARAPIYLQLSALSIISDLIANALAGLILLKSLWGLNLLGLSLFALSVLFACFLPETLRPVRSGGSPHGIDHDADMDATQASPELSPVKESLRRFHNSMKDIVSFLNGHRYEIILMICFVFSVLSRLVQDMLLQYTTKRFGWSWSKAAFLLTIRSAVSLVALIIVLPALSQFLLTKPKVSPIRKDVWIARITGLAGILGSLLIALSSTPGLLIPGLVIFALSGGMLGVLRSLLSSMVEPRHMGTLNSLIAVLEMVGLMIAGPSLFWSLRLGIEWGGGWSGLPFFCAAAMLSVSTAVVSFLPIRKKQRPYSPSHEEEVI
ncbi:putative Major facilitator superfamily domain-containing protein [Seiridium cardinale]|uniref:Major facilitator superfamily domain-containing protein n=1 Tax=Seiridium cardinale TaxID=138064 RepID=A0ABR2XVW0_9PEZI